MRSFSLLFLFLTLLSVSVCAQAHLSLATLDSFPMVVHNGASYRFGTYIHNTGSSNSPAVITLNWAKVNGPAHQIDFFQMGGPIKPADSVYWTVTSYTFPSASLSPGKNDILVWPALPSGNTRPINLDTLSKEVYFAERAAFRMDQGMIQGVGKSLIPGSPHNLMLYAQNVGPLGNRHPVAFFMQIGQLAPVKLGVYQGTVQPGDSAGLSVQGFDLLHYVTGPPAIIAQNHPKVSFWAESNASQPAVSKGVIPIFSPLTHVEPSSGSHSIALHPNPSGGIVALRLAPELLHTVTGIELLDVEGRKLLSVDKNTRVLNLQDQPKGVYLISVRTEHGILVKKLLLY